MSHLSSKTLFFHLSVTLWTSLACCAIARSQSSVFQIPRSSTPTPRVAQFQTPGNLGSPQAPILNFPNSTLQLPPVSQPPNTISGFQTPFPIQPAPTQPLLNPPTTQFNTPPAQIGVPNFQLPNQPTPFNPGFQQPIFPNSNAPNNGLFSGFFSQQPSNGWQNSASAWPNQFWARLRNDYIPRLLETPRYRHTWVQGNNGNELGLNEVELATTMNFPNWLNSTQPLRLTPGFTFLFWDGPDTGVTGFDLPSRTYSAFLAADFISNPNQVAGFETNLTVGVYSDFDNLSSDSLRITGVGLGWYRINSYMVGKLGVEYFDRIDLKLLPAVGVFLSPNQDLRLDVYFPRPKLAHRLPNWRNLEVWGYVGAEYGGGSWAIERTSGLDDQVDINDVRAFIGAEWLGPRGRTGLAEFGYLFEREMIYRSQPNLGLDLQDAVMFRLGLTF